MEGIKETILGHLSSLCAVLQERHFPRTDLVVVFQHQWVDPPSPLFVRADSAVASANVDVSSFVPHLHEMLASLRVQLEGGSGSKF